MKKEELKELAKILDAIADGEPWQFRKTENFPDSQWVDAGMMADPARILKDGGEIRIKPWELSRSINGHRLPEGAEWHRQDWTEDMLPDGYRPLLLGEKVQDGDERKFLTAPWDSWPSNNARYINAGSRNCPIRTTRPIPFVLTPAQIADGWLPWSGGECPVDPESRPMVMFRNKKTENEKTAGILFWADDGGGCVIIAYKPDPYGKFRQALADGRNVQFRAFDSWADETSLEFCEPVECYRIKPEPQWLLLGPEDINPATRFRVKMHIEENRKTIWITPVAVTTNGLVISVSKSAAITIGWSALETDYEQNTSLAAGKWDDSAWEPCRKLANETQHWISLSSTPKSP